MCLIVWPKPTNPAHDLSPAEVDFIKRYCDLYDFVTDFTNDGQVVIVECDAPNNAIGLRNVLVAGGMVVAYNTEKPEVTLVRFP